MGTPHWTRPENPAKLAGMTDKNILKPGLWVQRPVADTVAVYQDWAATYDAEVTGRGYHTPDRIAQALTRFVSLETPILDYGCGTGLSGLALAKAGFTTLDGTDVTVEMLDRARKLSLYRRLWHAEPGIFDFETGAYPVIAAVGVISLGAAPADVLPQLVAKLAPGGILTLSFNDPTLADDSYERALTAEVQGGRVSIEFREHGRHLDDVKMGSDVMVLRRI